MLDNIIHLIIAIINLIFLGYLIHVIGGLIRYGRDVFEYRNKTLSIIILVLTIIQVSKKEKPQLSQSLKLSSQTYDYKNIIIENRWFSDFRLSIYKSKENDIHKVNFSHTGLVLGINYFGIINLPNSDKKPTSIDIFYLKEYQIYGIQVYSVLTSKKVRIDND